MARILVIDDQADIRTVISLALRVKGFEVVCAADGGAGLREFDGSTFDLVIVDIFMDGMHGGDVIDILRGRVPGLPIIAISGMAVLDYLSADLGSASLICLQKPFRPTQLIAAVQLLLESGRGFLTGAQVDVIAKSEAI
jgi:DNA-binding response OmpR family regulator